MMELWKFLTRDKLDAFAAILVANDIAHEVLSKGSRDTSKAGITLAVEEGDYDRAKRLLGACDPEPASIQTALPACKDAMK